MTRGVIVKEYITSTRELVFIKDGFVIVFEYPLYGALPRIAILNFKSREGRV